MFLDKLASLGEDVAFGDTGPSLVLGPDIDGNPSHSMGPGKPILVLFTGAGLATAGTPVVVIEEQDPAVPGWSELMRIVVGPQTANAGGVIFGLPTSVSAEIRMKTENFTAGTFSGWIVLSQ